MRRVSSETNMSEKFENVEYSLSLLKDEMELLKRKLKDTNDVNASLVPIVLMLIGATIINFVT